MCVLCVHTHPHTRTHTHTHRERERDRQTDTDTDTDTHTYIYNLHFQFVDKVAHGPRVLFCADHTNVKRDLLWGKSDLQCADF